MYLCTQMRIRPRIQKQDKRKSVEPDAAFQTSKEGVSTKRKTLSKRSPVLLLTYCHTDNEMQRLTAELAFCCEAKWLKRGQTHKKHISAVIRYFTAIAVCVPRGDKVRPSCLLTCLLITKGHPPGTQRWPLNAQGYSIKTKAWGKEEVIRRGEGIIYRLK